MEFLKKLFGRKQPPGAGESPIEEIWEEFLMIRLRPELPLIKEILSDPYHRAMKLWLKPPTACPMGKSFIRAMVDFHRGPQGCYDDLAFVYQGEPTNWTEPPESSLEAMAQTAGLMRVKVTVYYKPTPDDEWSKLELDARGEASPDQPSG